MLMGSISLNQCTFIANLFFCIKSCIRATTSLSSCYLSNHSDNSSLRDNPISATICYRGLPKYKKARTSSSQNFFLCSNILSTFLNARYHFSSKLSSIVQFICLIMPYITPLCKALHYSKTGVPWQMSKTLIINFS